MPLSGRDGDVVGRKDFTTKHKLSLLLTMALEDPPSSVSLGNKSTTTTSFRDQKTFHMTNLVLVYTAETQSRAEEALRGTL